MPWVIAIAALAKAGYDAYSANKAKKAAQNLSYTPIDIDAIQKKAQETARQNIEQSLALEKQYTPDLARSREELQKQVASDLAGGGNLPTDVANAVTRSSMASANGAGFSGAAGPITAASLGMTALDVRNMNQQKAANLLNANPLPQSGLSPGDIASLAVGKTNTENQFNMSKEGAIANARQSMSNAVSSGIGAAGSLYSAYANNSTPSTIVSTATPTTSSTSANQWTVKSPWMINWSNGNNPYVSNNTGTAKW